MNRSLLRNIVIFAVVLPACNARDDAASQAEPADTETQAAPGSAAADPSVAHHPEPPNRPQEKTDSLQVEGMWEQFTARLVAPTTAVPFSTYVPPRMEFDQQAAGEGEGFYFYAAFNGERNPNAFMLVFLLPQGADEAQARTLANAFRASRSGARQSTRVQLGEYNGRHFYVGYTYPAEFGDGMGPRTHYIREQWIWHNDGKSLNATLGAPLE
jgi:hypothetical protein